MLEQQDRSGDKRSKVYGTPGPGKGPVVFRAISACDCGCGRKARFEFCVDGVVTIDDPEAVRALIIEMQKGYALLWGSEEVHNGDQG